MSTRLRHPKYAIILVVHFLIFYNVYSNCDSVVLPKVAAEIKGKEQEFCPRCECKYESRNTTTIKARIFSILSPCLVTDFDHF